MHVSCAPVGRVSKDPVVHRLRVIVEAAQEEMLLATAFYETWLPTIEDEKLHERLGHSFATQAFNVIQFALVRELMLALTRVWDTSKGAIGLHIIQRELRKPTVIDRLIADRKEALGMRYNIEAALRVELEPRFTQVIECISEYLKGGSGAQKLKNMLDIRNNRLAHREASLTPISLPEIPRADIEEVYWNTLELVQLLLSAINGVAFDLSGERPHRRYAQYFWAGVRGERAEGHPDYRGPISP